MIVNFEVLSFGISRTLDTIAAMQEIARAPLIRIARNTVFERAWLPRSHET